MRFFSSSSFYCSLFVDSGIMGYNGCGCLLSQHAPCADDNAWQSRLTGQCPVESRIDVSQTDTLTCSGLFVKLVQGFNMAAFDTRSSFV